MFDNRDRKSPIFIQGIAIIAMGSLSIAIIAPVYAQITPDNTLGNQQSIVSPIDATRDRITGGATRGSNLFHSFQDFNIDEGRAAYFANPAAIKTIFSRVTGGNPSAILGTLGVEGNANLFFINPAGILFGEGAKLDLSGSFIASTANSLIFPNGENFSATNPNAPPLLTIDVPVPIGLQFESGDPGIILNESNLQTGQNLALVGGAIASNGQISAPGKNITLSTVPATVNSVVQLDETGNFIKQTIQGTGQPNTEAADILIVGGSVNAASDGIAGNVVFNSAGDIFLTDGAIVNVRGAGGGNIAIKTQNLEMSGGSQLLAGIGAGLGSSGARAGDVTLEVANGISLRQDSRIENRVNENALGNAGDINVRAGSLTLTEGGYLSTSTFGQGNGGDVRVEADGAVKLDGFTANSNSRITSTVDNIAVGNGGNIEIQAESLSLSNGAVLNTLVFGATDEAPGGQGNAGDIAIQANLVSLSDDAEINTSNAGRGNAGRVTIWANDQVSLSNSIIFSNIGSRERTASVGNVGTIEIKANSIFFSNGAQLQAGIFSGAQGKTAGLISVEATDSVSLTGDGTAFFTDVEASAIGNGSNIEVSAPLISFTNGALLIAANAGKGNGGDINLTATDRIVFEGVGSIGLPSFASSDVRNGAIGNGGNINIVTGSLYLKDNAFLSASTSGRGNSGNVTITASNSIFLDGGSIRNTVGENAWGNGGAIDIKTDSLSLINESGFFANTFGQGNAGNLTITGDRVSVDNSLLSSAVLPGAEGNGGKITINANSLSIINGLGITTSTAGRGNSGSVSINVGNTFSLNNGSSLSTEVASTGIGNGGNIDIAAESFSISNKSAVFTSILSFARGSAGNIQIKTDSLSIDRDAFLSALTDGQGDGGNISIEARDRISLSNKASINSSVGSNGQGNGGNIDLTTKSFSATDGASISAATFGNGNAGNIQMNAGSLSVSNRAAFSTNTDGQGNGGTITINARDTVSFDNSSAFSGVGRNGVGNSGNLNIFTNSLQLTNDALLFVLTLGQGNSGNITINANETIFLDRSIISSEVSTGAVGDGGKQTIDARSLSLTNGAQLNTSTLGQGNAGDIVVKVDDSVNLTNTSLISSGVGAGGVGNGGNIEIQARFLTLTNGSNIQAPVFGEGNGLSGGRGDGGNIRINTTDFVSISGFNAEGFPSGLFTNTQRGTEGAAGNIIVSTETLRLTDGAVLQARTENSDRAGNIAINANIFEATGGGKVITATRSSGNAGNIILNVRDNLILSGSDPTFAERAARLNEGVFTNQDSASGLFANTTEGSTGNGGSIFIDPRTVTISDGATISVNSQGSGIGGQIELTAGSLTLDEGTISAQTASTSGGNISLNIQDLLLLRNGSQISTNAGTERAGGNGGNIFINAGAIIAIPQENSDITANAFLGRGGNITINTESIFGIDFRQRLTPLSDITASSEAGLAGSVEINTSGIDPTRGLEGLTEERINVEVSQGCQVRASGGGKLAFFNVGRGGLPPSPEDLLNGSATGEWLPLESETAIAVFQTERNTKTNNLLGSMPLLPEDTSHSKPCVP